MTTSTLEHGTPAAPAGNPASTTIAPTRLSALGLLKSEWIKLRSLRSTAWTFGLVIVVSLALAALMSLSMQLGGAGASLPAKDQALFVMSAATFGVFFGQLIVSVLGVLSISGEYSTGMIKSTLTAVPRRLGALWAKAIVLFLATFVVGVLSTFGSFLVAMPILAAQGLSASLFDPNILIPLLGASLYLALVAVFALGIGAIVRSSAGGIAAALGIVVLLPMILGMIPAPGVQALSPFLISNAGIEMFAQSGFGTLDPLQNLLVVLAWVTVSIAGAAALLKRRDA